MCSQLNISRSAYRSSTENAKFTVFRLKHSCLIVIICHGRKFASGDALAESVALFGLATLRCCGLTCARDSARSPFSERTHLQRWQCWVRQIIIVGRPNAVCLCAIMPVTLWWWWRWLFFRWFAFLCRVLQTKASGLCYNVVFICCALALFPHKK